LCFGGRGEVRLGQQDFAKLEKTLRPSRTSLASFFKKIIVIFKHVAKSKISP
jgi:hypothetical protein